MPPDGTWLIWLILAGRGWGKTRTGAEWVQREVTAGRRHSLALIGSTVADIRDIMIEGESGILQIAPPWFKPEYKPSLRKVVWPNGAEAITYSAEDPDQLRGPNIDGAWCDELCLVAGTMIATSRGPVPIERVSPGDMVPTRKGMRRVAHAWQSSPSAKVYRLRTSDGRELVGTAMHPVWARDKGFTPLHSLLSGDILEVWDIASTHTTESRERATSSPSNRASCGMGVAGGSTAGTTATAGVSCCIAPSTRRRMGRSRQEWTSTTRTAIRRITPSPTWKRSRALSISTGIARVAGAPGDVRSASEKRSGSGSGRNHTSARATSAVRRSPRPARAHGSAPQPAARGTTAPRDAMSSAALPSPGRVSTAVRHLGRIERTPGTAHSNATTRPSSLHLEPASSVVPSSTPETRAPNAAPARAATPCVVVSVEPLEEPRAVYNLEVEGEHEYYANGILTHNCAWRYAREAWDMLMFTLRSGNDPRAVVTTTPRPTKIVRELVNSPTTHVTRGRTADNAANLAPAFMAHIVAKYAGTRLGRQELDAEILDDNPGALWKRDELDGHRVIKHPDLVRVEVGVDPAATSGEDSDETGIIGAGVDATGHGYILEDASLRGTPHQWATAAVTLYHKLRADRIVAEVNNGGEMVEYTIHTIDPSVPVKMVHASRGKVTRAEPISTAYERGGVSHVGTFPTLEDQLCAWTQGDKSPDRLDALVWVLTDLDVGGTVRSIPLADEPDPAAPETDKRLVDAIHEAQADPFAYADKLGLW